MTQPHKLPPHESRRAPLRLAPLPRPAKAEPAPQTADPDWILEWTQPAPRDPNDA